MTYHSTGIRSSIHAEPQSANDLEVKATLLKVLERILHTHEVRQLLAESLPIIFRAWAGKQRLKQTVAKIMAGCLKMGVSEPPAARDDAFKKLCADPEFLSMLAQLIAGLYAGNQEMLLTAIKSVEDLPPQEQIDWISKSLAPLLQNQSADILTESARLINSLHQADPGFLARLLEPGFKKWVQSADFGELKQAVDGSADGIVSLVEMANKTLWQYPAKVVLCFALIPAFMNILGRSILVSAKKLEEIPPDLLTDIVTALIREIDGTVIAELMDAFAEIVRRLHTGNVLLGEAGSPQLARLFSEKLSEVFGAMDAAAFWQSRIQVAELMAAFDYALVDAVHQNPALLEHHMRNNPLLTNLRWRRLNHRLTRTESLDDDEFVRFWSQHLAATDSQEAAEIFNNFLYLINRLADQNHEAWAGIISRFLNALDSDTLAQTVSRFFDDSHRDLLPPARAVIPNLVTWISRVLEPTDDAFEAEAAQARKALRRLLKTAEV